MVQRWLPSVLPRVLGRRILWRVGRSLYQRARADVGNDLSSNGERDAVRAVIAANRSTAEPLVFLDVGANRGAWTLAVLDEAEKLGMASRVHIHAFEPVEGTFAELTRRLDARTGRVTLVRTAVSNSVGTADMFVTAPGAGTNSLVADSGAAGAAVERVPTTTVDAYCLAQSVKLVHYLKCDAEGHDWLVISGAERMLSEGRVLVLQFEYNHRWIGARHYLRDVFELARDLPYSVGKVLPDRIETYQQWHPELERFFEGNYVLIHHDARPWLPLRPVSLDESNTFA